jgi:1-acyl-sn-glycerol-3-phosphate acyltransferase
MIAVLRIAVIAAIFLSLTFALLPLQLIAMNTGMQLMRYLPRWWHRIMAPVIGLRIVTHGKPARERPLLLVSNHVSWKDIIVLGAVADVVFVAKSEVKDWPVFGWLARLQRSVFVEREKKRSTTTQVGDMAGRLAAGEIVVLFPEGTTSDGNAILPFKTSLFGAAAAVLPDVPGNTVHIQPVTIAYTGIHGMPMGRYHRPIAAWPGSVTLVPHLLRVLKEGALDVEVIFGEPVAFDATTDRKAIARRIEAEIRETLAAALRGRARG